MILDLTSIASLASQWSSDFLDQTGEFCRLNKISYSVSGEKEDREIGSKARLAFLQSLSSCSKNSLIKVAFDTRKIDQETERNPRSNLQFYHRSDPFITEEDQEKINAFGKLLIPLNEIKDSFGATPEYLSSYARVLYENVNNVLRTKDGQLDIFRPQMEYLSQILYLRYRLSQEDLQNKSKDDLKKVILAKDETLLKRGMLPLPERTKASSLSIKDGSSPSPENLIAALFQPNLRRDGEKSVERTITITIKDSVLEA